MKGKYFNGISGVSKETPNGGKITVAFGYITDEDDKDFEAIAFQVLDKNGDTVTEFALQPDSFGVLIEAIKELYDEEFGQDLDQPL